MGRMSEPGVHVGTSQVAKHTVLSMVAILALGGTRLVFNVLVGHRFGKEVLGQVNTELAAATFASLAFAAGLAIAATKFVAARLGAGSPPQAWQTLLVLTRWCVLGTLAAVTALAVTLPLLLPELSGADVAWTCLLLVAYSAYTFVRGAQYAYGTVRRYAVLEVAADSLTVAGATVVVLLEAETLLLLPFVAGYTLFAVLGWLGLPRPPRSSDAELPPGLRQEMRGYGFWAAFGVMASTGFLQLSMVFAFHYGSAVDAGLYAAAMTLTVPAYFVPRALSMALFPSMANAFGRGDEEEIRRQVDAGTRLLTVATLPFFAATVLLARPILVVVFGRDFSQAHVILELLLAATYILICSIPAVNSLSATERGLVRVPTAAAMSGLTVGVLGWLILGPTYTATGIAVGYLCGAVVISGTCMVVAWRRWRQAWGTLLGRVGLVVLFTVGLWILVDLRSSTVATRLGCVVAVAAITALLCPGESRQVLGRLRQVARQARGIVGR